MGITFVKKFCGPALNERKSSTWHASTPVTLSPIKYCWIYLRHSTTCVQHDFFHLLLTLHQQKRRLPQTLWFVSVCVILGWNTSPVFTSLLLMLSCSLSVFSSLSELSATLLKLPFSLAVWLLSCTVCLSWDSWSCIYLTDPRLMYSSKSPPMSYKYNSSILTNNYPWSLPLRTVCSFVIYLVSCHIHVICGPELLT